MGVRLQLSILGREQGTFHSISTGQYHTHPFNNNKQMQDPTFIHPFPMQVGLEMFNYEMYHSNHDKWNNFDGKNQGAKDHHFSVGKLVFFSPPSFPTKIVAKVILADGPRGCDMFAAAFNAAYAPWMAEIPRLKPPFGCQKIWKQWDFNRLTSTGDFRISEPSNSMIWFYIYSRPQMVLKLFISIFNWWLKRSESVLSKKCPITIEIKFEVATSRYINQSTF